MDAIDVFSAGHEYDPEDPAGGALCPTPAAGAPSGLAVRSFELPPGDRVPVSRAIGPICSYSGQGLGTGSHGFVRHSA